MSDKYDLNKEIFDDDSGITVGTPFCHEHCCAMVCFDGINFECVECNINKTSTAGGGEKMTNLKESAAAFIPSKMKNVADLPSVDVSLELKDGEGVDDAGKTYKYKYFEVEGEKYRVPSPVLGQLKDILEVKPDLKTFKVKKSGQGKEGTKYTTIQLT